MKATVIIIGRADIIKLGLIRSLGIAGCKVIAIQLMNNILRKYHPQKPLDYYSKYVNAYHFVKQDNLVDFLLYKYADETNRPIIFTLDDTSVYLIDKAYNSLRNKFQLSNINQESEGIIRLMDKYAQKTLAGKAGLNVPKGWIIEYVNDGYIVPDDIEYPCFIKPMLCYHVAKGQQRRCDSKEDLMCFLKQSVTTPQIPLIAEQFIPIEKEIGVIGICFNGKCFVPAKLTKTESETGKGSVNGVTMIGNIVPINDKDADFYTLHKFLTSLNYTGIINLDFVESQGKQYFLEVNFRYAAYGYGLALANVNLPALYINMIHGEKIDAQLVGVKRFFNEKIAVYNVIGGFMAWKQYKAMRNEADFCAIESKDDSSPYIHFKIRYILLYIKSRIIKYLSGK